MIIVIDFMDGVTMVGFAPGKLQYLQTAGQQNMLSR